MKRKLSGKHVKPSGLNLQSSGTKRKPSEINPEVSGQVIQSSGTGRKSSGFNLQSNLLGVQPEKFNL
ncbi:hypothetical protein [Fluviicola chungangensis]|uniref:Uncharacterized protein n=1 Tax=Fluviicola chungangensis TaxID=2597671 RepID=A0A556N3J5_9FLAO|nr:hypothetical protein [Fluviicola chungangensis]TSJ46639.1 hypothetical protein FO442_05630 [Fluviicola chungangensis]